MRFHSLYGQTEHAFIAQVPPGDTRQDSDWIAKFPDEIMIVDDTGSRLPAKEVGEIVCRCRCGAAMKGYYRHKDATERTLRGDDLYTGDLGYLDDEGYLHFVGREKDALRVRGEMVSVEYIKHLVHEHPKIEEVAIVGYRPEGKEALQEDEIVAHLVLQDGKQMTAQEFHEWSESNLARFMRPRYIFFCESLPKTATDRVQRYKLREEGISGATKLF